MPSSPSCPAWALLRVDPKGPGKDHHRMAPERGGGDPLGVGGRESSVGSTGDRNGEGRRGGSRVGGEPSSRYTKEEGPMKVDGAGVRAVGKFEFKLGSGCGKSVAGSSSLGGGSSPASPLLTGKNDSCACWLWPSPRIREISRGNPPPASWGIPVPDPVHRKLLLFGIH